MITQGWLDLRAGASGDMLLGALADSGVPITIMASAVSAISAAADESLRLRVDTVHRHGLGATQVHVEAEPSRQRRNLSDVLQLLNAAGLADFIRDGATAVFRRLAEAEAEAHRTPLDRVRFHEVGALDALADVVGVIAGFAHLNLAKLSASAVSVGSGVASSEHGAVPVPAPAVLTLLRGVPIETGPTPHESCTPTGAALLTHLVHEWGTMPPLRVDRVGHGAGTREPAEYPNLVRLVLGTAAVPLPNPTTETLIEANIDDLDPRLWPHVLGRLLQAGAVDVWLTPIIMKKGRSAHTLSVLCPPEVTPTLTNLIFAETSTIGLRSLPVNKIALQRSLGTVEVDGHRVETKTAHLDGEPINISVEYDDIEHVARITGRPAKSILRAAEAAAQHAAELK